MNNFRDNSNRINPALQPPPTPLANSLTQGRGSQVRAGNDLLCGNNPTPVFETPGTFAYLLDLVPDVAAGRLVELQAEAPWSAQTTLVMSYRATDELEQANYPDGGENGFMSTDIRDFRVLMKFGNGNAAHDLECDITEGSVVTIPGSNINCSLYSTHFNRWTSRYTRQNPLKTQASLASYSGVTAGTITDRVNAPMQAALDLLDPPTIEEWLKDLWEAICESQYLLGAEGPEV